MTTAYITHEDCLRHEMGAGHPECPDRLKSINASMRSSGFFEELQSLEAPLAQSADLKRIHDGAYVDLAVRQAAGIASLDVSMLRAAKAEGVAFLL